MYIYTIHVFYLPVVNSDFAIDNWLSIATSYINLCLNDVQAQ